MDHTWSKGAMPSASERGMVAVLGYKAVMPSASGAWYAKTLGGLVWFGTEADNPSGTQNHSLLLSDSIGTCASKGDVLPFVNSRLLMMFGTLTKVEEV